MEHLWLLVIPIGAVLAGASVADLFALRRGHHELRRRGRKFRTFPDWGQFPSMAVRLGRVTPAAPSRRIWRGVRWTILGVVVVAGWFAFQIIRDFASIDRYNLELAEHIAGEPMNILLVGSDSRENASADDSYEEDEADQPSGRRADTIMVLHLDEVSGRSALLSLPRDLWITPPGFDAPQRINGTYGVSRQLLVDTVTSTTGVDLHHYVEVDFTAFRRLVDAVGGVSIEVSDPVRDEWTGFFLPDPGCQQLDGLQALEFVRSRHLESYDGANWIADAGADQARVARQQTFLVTLGSSIRDSNIADPRQIRRLTGVAGDHLGIDRALSLSEMLRLARRLKDLDPAALESFVVPTDGLTTPQGESVLTLRPQDLRERVDAFLDRHVETGPPALASGVAVPVVGPAVPLGAPVDMPPAPADAIAATSDRPTFAACSA